MSTFGVHKVCWRALHDPAFRALLADEPRAALDDDRLDDDERQLLLAGAVDQLYLRGANAYLLANLMRTGVLGVTKDSYVARMSALAAGAGAGGAPQGTDDRKGTPTR